MKEIYLYGEVGYDITVKSVKDQLSDAEGQDVKLCMYSAGGSFFEGIAIYNAIKSYEGNVVGVVEGLAASMMTYIMLACSKIEVMDGSYLMIHNPMNGNYGDYESMKKNAEMLEKLRDDMALAYAEKTGRDLDEIMNDMSAETWLSAAEALEYGLIDEVIEGNIESVAAKVDIPEAIRKNLPDKVKAIITKTNNTTMDEKIIQALGLEAGSDVKAVLESVASLKGKNDALTNELNSEKELRQGVEAKLNEAEASLKAFETERLELSVAKELDSVLNEANVSMLSEERETSLKARVKAYLSETDETRSTQMQEDAVLFAKAYGVANKGDLNAGGSKRKDFSGETTEEQEAQIIAKTNELIKAKGIKNIQAQEYYNLTIQAKKELGI